VFKKQLYLFFILAVFGVFKSTSQEIDSLKVNKFAQPSNYEFKPLAPATAAFYSAILPGLGQAYNKKYWKIPIVYAALGSGIYFYSNNNTNYKRVRNAYKLSIDGKPHEFDGTNGNILLSNEALVRAQKSYKKDRDLSLLVTVGLYLLQIVEASTNAHLLQHNVDDNLTINPQLIKNEISNKTIVGASLNFKF
jgi:hypothetical protein